MNQWLVAWRNLMRRKMRSFLTMMAIVIGVASTFGVIAAVDSAKNTFPTYLKQTFGKADFNLNGSEAYFSEEIYKDINGIDQAAAVAVLKENSKLHLEQNGVSAIQKRVQLTGYSNLDTPITDFKVIEGNLKSDGAVITDRTAKVWKKEVGDTISFDTDNGIKTIKITAIVNYTVELMGPSSWMMAKYHPWSVAVPLTMVQNWYDRSGKIDNVQIKAASESGLKSVEKQLDAFVKQNDGIFMIPVVLDFEAQFKMLDSFFLALYLAGFLGIVLSAFIIFNSLFVSIKERKTEFAVLKTIGYTPSQIQTMVFFEVLLLSVIGTIIGLVLGYGLGIGLKALIFLISSVHSEGSMVLGKGLVISVLAGILVPLVASFYPIRQAGKISVIEVLKENRAAAFKPKKWLAFLGILLILSGFFIKHLLLIVPLMAGIALLFPYLFKAFDFFLKRIYRLVFGMPGELASRNLNRNLGRTSMTSVILCLGIAMIVLMSSLNSALLQTYEKVIHSSYGGNLDIMLHHIEKDDLENLKKVEGVANATTYSMQPIIWTDRDKKRKLPIYGVGEEWIESFPLFTTMGETPGEVIGNLAANEIVLDRISFKIWGGKVGESITLDTLDGPQSFKVAAVVDTMKNSGYGGFLKTDSFKESFGINYERNALVLKDEKTSPLQLRENIYALFGERIEDMFGPEDWVSVISASYTGSFSIINALVILAIIVSGIGITNTLLISILERIREIGMMRAVGVTRGQIIGMILLEGFGIGVAATVIGSLFGVLLIYLSSTFVEINSLTFEFGVTWWILLIIFLFGILVSLISSFAPATRAAKTKLSEALRYE